MWVGTSTREVLVELNRFLKDRAVLESRWGPKQDRYLIEHYRTTNTRVLAEVMTHKFRRRFTKNMVISRYNKLRRSGDIERYKEDPGYRANRYDFAPGSGR